ncbi:MAG: cytochrome c oxidase subunit II [Alphaproteobacteria bacterium]|nr:cytochrome c oxidase subunit II [Alphaproteobacteria bacterium]
MHFFCLILILIFFISPLVASHPEPWQMTFQPAASPMMEGIVSMHHLLLTIISAIACFVVLLLGYVIYRFRAKKNLIPSKTSHHVVLEIIWTLVPVIILVIIGIPSIKLLFALDKPQDAQMTIKVIGRQWYWSYEYPTNDPAKPITFDSYMVEEKDLKPGMHRLLEVDNRVIVPVDTTVRILVTSSDVLHSFAVPSLGIKKDAVPGRINETWFRIAKEGVYYGQCSELCGVRHGFMPIAIHVVSKEQYDEWLKSKGT